MQAYGFTQLDESIRFYIIPDGRRNRHRLGIVKGNPAFTNGLKTNTQAY